jgi:hypothetical protein
MQTGPYGDTKGVRTVLRKMLNSGGEGQYPYGGEIEGVRWTDRGVQQGNAECFDSVI